MGHWQIITPKGAVTQTSHDRPYACLESKAWLSHCREQARAHGVDLITGQVTDIELNLTPTASPPTTAKSPQGRFLTAAPIPSRKG